MPNIVCSLKYVVGRSKTTHYKLPATHFHGFTLIELLIVISIIGILATLTLASYNGAQAKARDGVRKNDLAQVKRSMELAKSDCTNAAYYPNKADYAALTTFLKQGASYSTASYMNPIPTDPKSGTVVGTITLNYYFYSTNSFASACPPDTSGGAANNGSNDYTLMTYMERTTDTDGSASWGRCTGKPYSGTGHVGNVVPSGSYPGLGVYLVCNN